MRARCCSGRSASRTCCGGPTRKGISGGGAGLYMHPRDMAKIGYLYLRGGVWEGKQILPASWIEGVRKADVDMRESWAKDLRYGSQFWVMPGRDAYMAVGYDRQLIVVMPKLDIVAVMTGSARFSTAMACRAGRATASMLIGQLPDGRRDRRCAAAGQSRGDGRLAQKIKEAAIERPAPAAGSRRWPRPISGKTWRFAAQRHADQVHHLHARRRRAVLRIRGRWHSSRSARRGSAGRSALTAIIAWAGACATARAPPAAPGRLDDGTTLVLEIQTLGNDDVARVTFVFGDKTVEVTFELAIGFRATLTGRTDD